MEAPHLVKENHEATMSRKNNFRLKPIPMENHMSKPQTAADVIQEQVQSNVNGPADAETIRDEIQATVKAGVAKGRDNPSTLRLREFLLAAVRMFELAEQQPSIVGRPFWGEITVAMSWKGKPDLIRAGLHCTDTCVGSA
jgi:hypothetical protein